MMDKTTSKAVIAAMLLMSLSAPALAAGGDGTVRKSSLKGAKGSGNIKVDSADRAAGGEELNPAIEIEGRIYKPSVFYVVARRSINYEGLDFKQDFVDRIVKGALKRPF